MYVYNVRTGVATVLGFRTYYYFVAKVSFWLFKIFEIQKGRTFSFNDILRLYTIVIIAIRSRAYVAERNVLQISIQICIFSEAALLYICMTIRKIIKK